MKTRKNIRDAFKYNGGRTSKANDLINTTIESISEIVDNINDIDIFYDTIYRMTFSYGEQNKGVYISFDNIETTSTAYFGGAQDYLDVANWNTKFTLPTNGNPFTSVFASGNTVTLLGGSQITGKTDLFASDTHIIDVFDETGIFVKLNAGAFRSSSIINVIFNGVTETQDKIFESSSLTTAIFPELITAGDGVAGYGVFDTCTNLQTLNLPKLETMSPYFAYGCTSLTEFIAPQLTEISSDAFNGTSTTTTCINLTTVNAPNVTSIGDLAFYHNISVTSFDFPLLTTLGADVFVECYSADFNLPELSVLDGTSQFAYCLSGTTFYLPKLLVVNNSTFQSCHYATNINLASCTNLGDSVLNNDVFGGGGGTAISGQTMTLTIPAALMTNNGGNPDGDIQFLQANNTVTVIQV